MNKLKNTIITDIKDEAQHRRVQEKLFSMGHKWIIDSTPIVQNFGSGVNNMIAIGSKDMFQNPIGGSHYTYITANEFLSEVDKLIELQTNQNNKLTPKGKNIMSNIVSFAKDLLLSPNEKLLRKCGLHDEYGKNTNDARELIMDKFLNSPENQAYLLEVAEAKQADEKTNK